MIVIGANDAIVAYNAAVQLLNLTRVLCGWSFHHVAHEMIEYYVCANDVENHAIERSMDPFVKRITRALFREVSSGPLWHQGRIACENWAIGFCIVYTQVIFDYLCATW